MARDRDSIFYNDVKCIITNEGKTLFAKQSNGLKLAKVGCVLFSDKSNAIKNAYEGVINTGNPLSLESITLKQLKDYTTLIFQNINYDLEGNVYNPTNYYDYNNALENHRNLIPIQISYDHEKTFLSYDLTLRTNMLSINRVGNMNFDGFAILGLPFKPKIQEWTLPFLTEQNYAIIAIVYFPKDDQKLQILKNQPDNVAMNIEVHISLSEPIDFGELEYITNKGLPVENKEKFLYGLHLTNDGLHNKG